MRKIVIERDSFMYKWFLWSLKVVETWNDETGHSNLSYAECGTNLCHMMRVLLLWAPLGILTELAIIMVTTISFFAYPVKILGRELTIVYAVGWAVLVLTIALAIYIHNRRVDVEEMTETTTPKKETILTLIGMALLAQKRKICPLVDFTGKESK